MMITITVKLMMNARNHQIGICQKLGKKDNMIDSISDLFIFIGKKLTANKLLLMINDKSGEVAVALCSTGD